MYFIITLLLQQRASAGYFTSHGDATHQQTTQKHVNSLPEGPYPRLHQLAEPMITLTTLHSPSPLTLLMNFLTTKLQLGTQLVEVQHYKTEGRGFDSWCSHWIFYWLNPSCCTTASGNTEPLIGMITRNVSWRVKVASVLGSQPCHLHQQSVRTSLSTNNVSANTHMQKFELQKQRLHIHQSRYSQICVNETCIISELTVLTINSLKTDKVSKKIYRRFVIVTVCTSKGILDHHLTYDCNSTV